MIVPTQKEQNIAAIMHLAAIPAPYLGPIIAAITNRKSKFILFHALSAMISQVLTTLLLGSISIASIAYSLYDLYGKNWDISQIDWKMTLIKTAVVWLMLGLFALWNVVTAISLALRTYSHGWPKRFSLSQRIAAKWVGISPTAAVPISPNTNPILQDRL